MKSHTITSKMQKKKKKVAGKSNIHSQSNFGKPSIEGKFLNLIKGVYEITTLHIILKWQKTEAFPLDEERGKMPTVATSVQHVLEGLLGVTGREKGACRWEDETWNCLLSPQAVR